MGIPPIAQPRTSLQHHGYFWEGLWTTGKMKVVLERHKREESLWSSRFCRGWACIAGEAKESGDPKTLEEAVGHHLASLLHLCMSTKKSPLWFAISRPSNFCPPKKAPNYKASKQKWQNSSEQSSFCFTLNLIILSTCIAYLPLARKLCECGWQCRDTMHIGP